MRGYECYEMTCVLKNICFDNQHFVQECSHCHAAAAAVFCLLRVVLAMWCTKRLS